MNTATRDNLTRLIARVGQLMAEQEKAAGPRPGWTTSSYTERRAWDDADRRAWSVLEEKLERQEGARFGGNGASGHTLTMAGVRTSCTSGLAGLLRNWQTAARRKLEKEKA